MASYYRVLDDGRLVHMVIGPSLDARELLELHRQLGTDERIQPGFGALIDARLLQENHLQRSEIPAAAATAGQYPIFRKARLAVLPPDNHTFDLAMLYQQLVEPYGTEMIAFNLLRNAADWLGVEESAFEVPAPRVR